jgi:arginine:pyruvate transaminase
MYVMIDIRRTGMSGEVFATRLLDATGVALLPGEGFGKSGAGHVRLSLCAPDAVLLDACARIERFLSRQNLDEGTG